MVPSIGRHCALVVCLLLFISSVSTQEGKDKEKTEEEPTATNKTGPPLTGDPQIDYIHDPNLPIELHGYDLSNYPFYKRVPKEGHNFTCDDRLDGFYASVPHQCQVYYNCLFSQRYDFLCPNYTVFDQVNFICHYASEVDCKSSERFYNRNEELYVTTTTTTQAPKVIFVERDRPRPQRPRPLKLKRPSLRNKVGPKRRTTTPAPEYYDYYDQNYYDDYYEDEKLTEPTTTTTTTTTPKPRRRRPQGGNRRGEGGGDGGGRRIGGQRPGGRRRPGASGGGGRRRVRTTTTTTVAPEPANYDDYYYDDYYYYDDEAAEPAPPKKKEVAAPLQSNTRRSKPGQIRRPSFKRSQNKNQQVTNKNTQVENSPVEENVPSAIQEDYDTLDETRTNDGSRPVSRKVIDSPSNSEIPAEEETVNEEPAVRQTSRRRPSFRRPTPNEEEVPQRRRGSGFGGRRS